VGSVGVMSAIQTSTPPEALGRVIGTSESGGAIGSACGVLAAGALVDVVGVRPMLDVQACTYLCSGLIGFLVIDRAARREVTDVTPIDA